MTHSIGLTRAQSILRSAENAHFEDWFTALDLLCFSFGEAVQVVIAYGPRKGESTKVPRFELHIQCKCAFFPSTAAHAPAEPHVLRNFEGKIFSMPHFPLEMSTVSHFSLNISGELTLLGSTGWRLLIVPNSPHLLDKPDREQWRFIDRGNRGSLHLVFTTKGYYAESDT